MGLSRRTELGLPTHSAARQACMCLLQCLEAARGTVGTKKHFFTHLRFSGGGLLGAAEKAPRKLGCSSPPCGGLVLGGESSTSEGSN